MTDHDRMMVYVYQRDDGTLYALTENDAPTHDVMWGYGLVHKEPENTPTDLDAALKKAGYQPGTNAKGYA